MATIPNENIESSSNATPSGCRIFIKNLDTSIGNKALYETFSLFGKILTCKVIADEEGASKGHGFVHFETEEAAENAILKGNGVKLAEKEITVERYLSRGQRAGENVYVKNFGEDVDDEKLRAMFEKFGDISSCVVMRESNGKSKGFGFVAFKNAEHAEKSISEMNDTTVDSGLKLFVTRALKKSEREAEKKEKKEQNKAEIVQQHPGVNLYVKNIGDTVNDDALRELFEPFGKLTSVKVMTDNDGRSKGFGFVCFEKPEDATKAVTELNSKMVYSKPLYVAVAQRKDDRRAQLAFQFMQMNANRQNSEVMGNNSNTPGNNGCFVPNMAQNQPGFAPEGVYGAAGMGMAQNGGWVLQQQPHMQSFTAYGGGPTFQTGISGTAKSGRQQYFVQGAVPPGYGEAAFLPTIVGQPQAVPQYYQAGPYPMPSGNMNGSHVNNQYLPKHFRHVQGGRQGQMNLNMAPPQQQKQLLGERVYSLVSKLFPGMNEIGKITGMMLEMDNAELMMILQDNNLFRSKVQEALSVLQMSAHPTDPYPK